MPRHILITGGLGFIGFHSIEKYLNKGWNITVVDNLSTNAININNPILNKVNVIIKDLVDFETPEDEHYNTILHLASPVGPVGVLKHAGVMARMITDDTYEVIKLAEEHNALLLFVSTSEIYGHREEKTYLQESSDKVFHGDFTVRNEYASAKLLSEMVITNYAQVHNLKYHIIRPFNVSGSHQLPNGGFVLPRFVIQALANEDITVYYTGSQIRAFTWVKDIVDGIYLCGEFDAYPDHWNIGNKHNEQSILYLAKKVKEISGSKSKIVHVDPKDLHGPLFSEAPEKIPDSTKIEKVLGWSPVKGVDEVILEVINFWKNK